MIYKSATQAKIIWLNLNLVMHLFGKIECKPLQHTITEHSMIDKFVRVIFRNHDGGDIFSIRWLFVWT